MLVVAALCLLAGCESNRSPQVVPVAPMAGSVSSPVLPTTVATPPRSPIRFRHATDCGLDFTYYGNPSPQHYMTEQNGGGVAIFDYDRDGRADVFLTNGDHFEQRAAEAGAVHQLFRNQTLEGAKLQFHPVGQLAGISVSGFGMGAHAADYDNDGFSDLFLCYYGSVQLWRNNGDGTLSDVTTIAGLSGNEWATSAAFADLDEDGDLDLYVVNYVVYAGTDPPCYLESGSRRIQISCGPIGRTAQADRLWRNQGDGTFSNASESSGIRDVPPGKGLAVEIVDLIGDDRLDLYVANDTTENFLFVNRGGLTFKEQGIPLGVAVGKDGTPQSSMGIACADFDHNGRFDLFVTNFENAVKDVYLNVSPDGFLHPVGGNGLDAPSRPKLNFGTIAADFDLDSWPDLFVANGHIWDLRGPDNEHQYEMTPQLFGNMGDKGFRDHSATAGEYFTQPWLGRSAASGDLNNDGASDLVVSHELKPAAVLENQSLPRGRSVSVQLVGRTAAREPLGVRVSATVDQETREYHVPSGGSYQASSDPRLIISTGNTAETMSLRIAWTSTAVETWDNVPTQGRLLIVQGSPPHVITAKSKEAHP